MGGLWKDYEINDKSVRQFFTGQSELSVSFGLGIIRGTRGVLKAQSVIFKCLGDIVNFSKVSFTVTRNSAHDKSDYIYNIKFKDDGKGCADIDVSALKYISYTRKNTSRIVIPCFNDCYIDISLPSNKIPDYVVNNSYFKSWVNDFIFLPKGSNDKDADLEIIYDFYLKNSLLKVDKDSFFEKYTECWNHILN